MNKCAQLIYFFHQTESPYDNCSFTLSVFDGPIVSNANTRVSFQRLNKHPWIKVDGFFEMESRISQLQNQGYTIYGLETFNEVREYYERIETYRDETDSPSFIPQEILSSFLREREWFA